MKENNTEHDSVVVNSEHQSSDIELIENKINTLISKENDFWGNIDLKTAPISVLTDYLLSKKTFNEDEHVDVNDFERRKNKKEHNLIYMIRNVKNGHIYVGQHKTLKVFDKYEGSGVALNETRYSLNRDDFKKTILFDFDTFSEMNDMEGRIVTNDFKNRKDTYNKIIGGMQMETAVSRGMVMCHNNELKKEKYFYPDEIPDGWIKGGLSTFTAEEIERRVKLFTMLYTEYLELGYEKTMEKYNLSYTRTGFNVLCRHYAENFTSRGRRAVSVRRHVEYYTKLYNMYVEHGYDYVYENSDCTINRSDLSHAFRWYALGYERDKRINFVKAEKKKKYTELYEESKIVGIEAVSKMSGEKQSMLRAHFCKYVENYDKRRNKETKRKIQLTEEEESMIISAYRYYQTHTIEETMKEFGFERKEHLRDYILKRIDAAKKEEIDKEFDEMRKMEIEDNVKYYTMVYEEYKISGYRGVVKKFGISKDFNFVQRQFRKYVKEYIDKYGKDTYKDVVDTK